MNTSKFNSNNYIYKLSKKATTYPLLEDHLRTIIGLDTETILNDVSPQKESAYESPNPFVLIGFVPTEDHMLCFTNSETPFYFSGEKKPSKFGFRNLKYFAPYIKKKGVREYYEIVDYQIMPRKQIFEKNQKLYKDQEGERLVIRLGKKYLITDGTYHKIAEPGIGRVSFRYTRLFHLKNLVKGKICVLRVTNN